MGNLEPCVPIDPDELVTLAPEAASFAQLLDKALRKDEDGKVRVSKGEAKAIADKALALAGHILRDVLD